MPTRVRRALLAAALPALLLAPAAGAVCTDRVCVATPTGIPNASFVLEEVIDGGGLPEDDNGSGVLCLYTKLSGPPPSGWGGDPQSNPPYVWQQTQRWGNEHPGEYDTRVCVPACAMLDRDEIAVPCPFDHS